MIDETILEDIQEVKREIKPELFVDKDILVTGGAGFIGSYLCDVFIELGARVTCLDEFSTGLVENIDHLKNRKCFKLVKADISKFEDEAKYDYVLHFASRASPEDYQLHPVETLLANSLGSFKMLELTRKCDAMILFASSSEVYGDAKDIPTPETYWGNVNPVGIRSSYDEGKRFAEALFMAYHHEYGTNTKIVRIHNTYGPRLRADGYYARVLSRFILQALKGTDLTVYGDGSQTRSFCYITDTVLGILSILTNEKCKGEVINIGSPYETSILNLAKKVKEMVESSSSITFHSLPEDDPKRRCPDVTKAREILGWTPKTSLEDGLRRSIKWFRRHTTI